MGGFLIAAMKSNICQMWLMQECSYVRSLGEIKCFGVLKINPAPNVLLPKPDKRGGNL